MPEDTAQRAALKKGLMASPCFSMSSCCEGLGVSKKKKKVKTMKRFNLDNFTRFRARLQSWCLVALRCGLAWSAGRPRLFTSDHDRPLTMRVSRNTITYLVTVLHTTLLNTATSLFHAWLQTGSNLLTLTYLYSATRILSTAALTLPMVSLA